MTRKDYKLIADAIGEWNEEFPGQEVEALLEKLCAALQKDNPAFSIPTFTYRVYFKGATHNA